MKHSGRRALTHNGIVINIIFSLSCEVMLPRSVYCLMFKLAKKMVFEKMAFHKKRCFQSCNIVTNGFQLFFLSVFGIVVYLLLSCIFLLHSSFYCGGIFLMFWVPFCWIVHPDISFVVFVVSVLFCVFYKGMSIIFHSPHLSLLYIF